MQSLEHKITTLSIERGRAKKSVEECEATIRNEKGNIIRLLKAREVLIAFSSQLQSDFKREVESLLTMAIQSVFNDREYEFRLDFKERKDRVEAIPIVFDGTLELIPKEDMGGGILPVIAFPLRVILLGGHRPIIWLDEPLKGALGRADDLFFRAIKMFKEISSKVGLQVIINTHEEDFMELADTVHKVVHNGRYSIVKRVKPIRKLIRRD